VIAPLLTPVQVTESLTDPKSPDYLTPQERREVAAAVSRVSLVPIQEQITAAVAVVLQKRGTR
jgi:hypothetical protein